MFEPHRYKAFYGGRGSAKSHSFATALVLMAAQKPMRIVCAREIQKSLRESVKQLIEDKIDALGLGHLFDQQEAVTIGRNGSRFIYMGMWRNPDAAKSLEGADVFWGEEASAFSARSLRIIRPTMRKPGSELWFSWNPEFDHDPVDKLFRGEAGAPKDSLIKEVSWRDNPWFADTPLQDEMEGDYAADPAMAEHVWGGGYVTAIDGAYFSQQLQQARADGRITTLAPDPILRKRAFWDLGRRDSTAIWIAQFVDREIRWLDYIEGQGQQLSYYIEELRTRGHGTALCVLPHDGSHETLTAPGSAYEQLVAAGFEAEVIKNQGTGAAMRRIEAARRLFPRMLFDADATREGVKVLGAYHERRDEKRNAGLGPEHYWASHGADAFGLGCVAYEEPQAKREPKKRYAGAGGWMG